MPLRMLEYSQRNHSPVDAFCRSFMGRGESAPAVFRNTRRYPGSMSCGLREVRLAAHGRKTFWALSGMWKPPKIRRTDIDLKI